jgi:hypothetical protein
LAVSCGGGGGGSTSNNSNNTSTPPVAITCSNGGGTTASQVSVGSGQFAQQVAACTQKLPTLLAPTTGNCVPVIVDAGPCAYGVPYGSPTGTTPSVFILNTANLPFTTVTICIPGTSTCQTIDHILVDTGSTGLRIMTSVLNPSITLPAVTGVTAPLLECVQFVDGYSWGSMRTADVRMAGEVASNIAVQVIGDSTSYTIPPACTGTAPALTALNDVVSFGANGVLGVGLFAQDCGNGCTTNAGNSFYYTCPTTTTCTGSTATLAQQATNPVFAFPSDNNGILIQLPAVAAATAATNLLGTMTLGINTQANNQAGKSTLHTYLADPFVGDFYSTLISVTGGYTVTAAPYSNSFIDSGSNGIYLPGTTIASDTTSGWFTPVVAASGSVPSDVVVLSATQQGTDPVSGAATGYLNQFQFDIANANTVLFTAANSAATVFNSLGAPSSGSTTSTTGGVDWGLPFFFGKQMYIGLEGNTVTINGHASVGPFWAY